MITNSSLPSERHVYRIGLLERLPLRTPYPSIAARVIDIVRRLPRGQTTVIVDRTGAHAAYDMLVEKGLSPIGMTISGGDSINWAGRYVTVPKMRLLTELLSICHRGELEIAKSLRDYSELRRQLQNIGTMATDSGTGETWRARRGHDDLVISVSMAGFTSQTRAQIWASGNSIGARPARRLRIIVSPSTSVRALTTVPSASCPAARRRHQSPPPSNPWSNRRAASSICPRG